VRALAMRIVSFKRVRKADVQWAHDLRLLFMCMGGRAASGGAVAPEPPRATGSDQSQGEFWQQESILVVSKKKKISCVL